MAAIYRPSPSPPGIKKEGPAALGADRAWGYRTELELPPTEANSATSVRPAPDPPLASFPAGKGEWTAAARMAIVGWELRRAELGDGYLAYRWDRGAIDLADLVAVAAFADQEGAPS